jgi:5-hydroxyisourate hydrolase / 2-oxo-4-hydroxy-4-carboxy-5-ureidoimidazoline decarboxylase
MTLDELNALDQEAAERELLRCCGSARWAQAMAEVRPYSGASALADKADNLWWSLGPTDWLEAFAAHPRIGERAASAWAVGEQSGIHDASDDERARLVEGNREYEGRFGYIFIVCATGKTAGEMLVLLEERLRNEPNDELQIAAEEQRKITRIRLAKLLDLGQPVAKKIKNMITTHVLDTARGGPAAGMTVILEWRQASEWSPIGRGMTDENGRVATLTEDRDLAPGTYRLTFDTGTYHRDQGITAPFFPEAKITFNVRDTDEHYHVPLLLSPFGYSTYRGT